MGMRNTVAIVVCLIVFASSAARAEPTAPSGPPADGVKKRKPDAADEFFAAGPIPRLRVVLTPDNLNKLRQDGRAYVEATVRETPLDGKGPEVVYERVGVHLKGGAGSYQGVDDRPGLTLSFSKYTPEGRFHGLEKIHLNNSVQDPSYMSENLGNALFREAGVPAARVTYARVSINDRDLQVFVLKEGFSDDFLHRFFDGPRGTLYEGGFCRDIDEGLSVRVNEPQAKPERVKELLAASRENDPSKRRERLGRVLDIDRFLTFMAMETMTAHWDGYCPNVNNYRVYHDAGSDRFVFLPHGTDQLFQQSGFPLVTERGMVARAITSAPDHRAAYLERVAELRAGLFTPAHVGKRLDEISARLAAAMESLGPDASRHHKRQTENLRERVNERIRDIDRQLASIPRPLKFDGNGVAALAGARWQPQNGGGRATVEQVEDGGRPRLRIKSEGGGESVASFRTTLTLAKGHYAFEGPCRTARVAAPDGQNSGAGLRISGGRRDQRLVGDSDWRLAKFDFEVAEPTRDVVLVCELRATAGEAWFDAAGLKLRRK
jgi:hypothetical protein